MSNFKLGNTSKKNLEGVDPRWIPILDLALLISPIDFGIPKDGGLRTAERQREMYLDPEIETKCDGYINISNHQPDDEDGFGKSVDVYAYVGGKASWQPEYLAVVAASILQAASTLGEPVEWGGFFEVPGKIYGWDMPHFTLL